MKQVNLFNFYTLGYVLHPLTEIDREKPLEEYYSKLFMAEFWLNKFLGGAFIPMAICRGSALKIFNAIERVFNSQTDGAPTTDLKKPIPFLELHDIKNGAKEFETVFSAEVQNMATYFVSKKGIFDTNDLISRADDLFADAVKEQLSDKAKTDIREAGKCLAFDLATATGFHIARAVEDVLLQYLTLLCPAEIEKMKDSQRNLGNYIILAKSNGGDEKVCNSLDQFRDLHRNPLIHPETTLSPDEALALLGIAQSAIVTLAMNMAKLKGQPALLLEDAQGTT